MTAHVADERPVLLMPYVWIGDFVRCHSVVKVLRKRFPHRPIDMLSSTLCAPLADYMPGVRRAIVHDFPRRKFAYAEIARLAEKLKREHYGTALIMSRKWKAALPAYLAGIPERVGFIGEFRYGLLSDVRWGEKKLPRMIDRCAALALPKGAKLPNKWPLPELVVPREEIAAWRARVGLKNEGRLVVALCPGAVGPGKRWPEQRYAELARKLVDEKITVWIVGGPNEKIYANVISGGGDRDVRNLTSNDLRNGIMQLAAANAVVSNDSGLLHVAAAIGTPVVGLFGPTSPWHWAPLNPIAAMIEAPWYKPCRTCGKRNCNEIRHRTTEDIPVDEVFRATLKSLGR